MTHTGANVRASLMSAVFRFGCIPLLRSLEPHGHAVIGREKFLRASCTELHRCWHRCFEAVQFTLDRPLVPLRHNIRTDHHSAEPRPTASTAEPKHPVENWIVVPRGVYQGEPDARVVVFFKNFSKLFIAQERFCLRPRKIHYFPFGNSSSASSMKAGRISGCTLRASSARIDETLSPHKSQALAASQSRGYIAPCVSGLTSFAFAKMARNLLPSV